MIPVLFESDATVFTSNGLGRLVDCISCTVTEERNGVYECEFEYPITGQLYSEIQEGRIIACIHDEIGDIQPFDIYKRSAPISGIVTFYAHHISYRLTGVIDTPFEAATCQEAVANLKSFAIGSGADDWTFYTDKSVSADMTVAVPTSIKSVMGGMEGSILDVYGGGEYEFDRFTVNLYASRGSAKDITIRYGKNLADLTQERNYEASYNGVVPYWHGTDANTGDDVIVTLTEGVIRNSGTTYDGRNTDIALDMTSDFQEAPTEAELRTAATDKINSLSSWLPTETLTVDFVQLWQTEEYADYAPLQTVALCDTVTVIYPELGITGTSAKIIKVVYNVLLERYDEMELGDPPATFGDIIQSYTTVAVAEIKNVADEAKRVAGSTTQYFWHTSTGDDTGAHITEIPQEEFTDPTSPNYHSGGNLLARTNGIAVRDGLEELAQFTATQATIGVETDQHIELTLTDTGITGTLSETTYDIPGASSSRTYRLRTTPSTSTNITAEIYVDGYDDDPLTFTVGSASSGQFLVYVDSDDNSYYMTVAYDGDRTFTYTAPSSTGTVYTLTFTYTPLSTLAPEIELGDTFTIETEYDTENSVLHTDATLDGTMHINTPNMGQYEALYVNSRDVFENKILWEHQTGGWHMNANQTVPLAEPISAQPHGIVLIWSRFSNNTTYDDSFNYFFVPKFHVGSYDTKGVYMVGTVANNSVQLSKKYVYVCDDKIIGQSNNTASGSNYNNSLLVLRAVIGV